MEKPLSSKRKERLENRLVEINNMLDTVNIEWFPKKKYINEEHVESYQEIDMLTKEKQKIEDTLLYNDMLLKDIQFKKENILEEEYERG